MLKHHLKISIRSIWKDKGYSLVNILGLGIAIACCLLLIFWIKYEVSFDRYHVNADRIYRVMEVEKRETGNYHTVFIRPGISDDLKLNFPQIEASTIVRFERLPFGQKDKKGEDMMGNLYSVQEDIFRIFSFEYLEGSPQAVVDTRTVVISEEFARKNFGNVSALGRTLYFSSEACTIGAVVRLPSNTQISFDMLSIVDSHVYGDHYIMLKEGVKITDAFESELANYLAKNRDTENILKLQSLKDIHLKSPNEVAKDSTFMRYGSLDQLILFSIAAILILIIAVVSYVNSSIARAMNRLKEVGVRKVTGGKKKQLIERFLCESFILSLISVLLAMAFVQLLFPFFTDVMGQSIPLDTDFYTVLIVIAVCLLLTCLSGGYAAFYLSSFSPILAFRGGSMTGSKQGFRKVLLGMQFFLSVLIMTSTVFIYKQIGMMINADTGVDKENILVLNTGLWYEAQSAFLDVIKNENPNIIDATIASEAPYNAEWGYSGVSWDGSDIGANNIEFSQIFCNYTYANTFGLELVAGRFIPEGLSWWQNAKPESFDLVVNESFVKLMGVDNPIGITVSYGWGHKGKIIGVVKDFNFKPLKSSISPLLISFNPEASSTVFIKTTGKDKQATLDYILKTYDDKKPKRYNRPAEYNWVEDDFQDMYKNEIRTAKILAVFTIISLLLSLMGISSMIAFMVEKRTKEIAVRKINGAQTKHIISLFVLDISKIGLAASLLAMPVSYYFLHKWLEDYAYKTELSWWIFLLVASLIIAISALLIAIQVFFISRKNPIESLRSE